MDSINPVDTDVAAAAADAERVRQAQEQLRAKELRNAQDSRNNEEIQEAQRQASQPQPVVSTAPDVLGIYINTMA